MGSHVGQFTGFQFEKAEYAMDKVDVQKAFDKVLHQRFQLKIKPHSFSVDFISVWIDRC